ncbi:hypothetical protein AC1031_020229 [Aphanomyces cochlioides]|nr:hypothetical protein AC1031_020229 [Aphanomyces cochlioides]
MRVRHNRMQWHPNNMTMKEIVKELESLSDSLDDTRNSQELEAASVKPLEDITAFLNNAEPVGLWQWIGADPHKANWTLARASMSGTGHTGHSAAACMAQMDELALAALEIILATQVSPYYFSEAWLVSVSNQPVIWLPVVKAAPMVASTTLWRILHSTFGHQLVQSLHVSCPNGLTEILTVLQKHNYSYDDSSMLMFIPGKVPTLEFGTPYHT